MLSGVAGAAGGRVGWRLCGAGARRGSAQVPAHQCQSQKQAYEQGAGLRSHAHVHSMMIYTSEIQVKWSCYWVSQTEPASRMLLMLMRSVLAASPFRPVQDVMSCLSSSGPGFKSWAGLKACLLASFRWEPTLHSRPSPSEARLGCKS